MPVRFSVIIPVGTAATPAAVLDSLDRLRFPKDEFEIIVEAGPNPSRNRNRAIARAAGGILAFVDDDCVVDPDWLDRAHAFFTAYERYDVVGGPQLTPASDGFLARASGYVLASRFGAYRMASRYRRGPLNLAATEVNLSSANIFIKRHVFERCGLFDTRLWPNEETELLCRVERAGGRMAYDPALVVYHKRRRDLREFARQCFRYGTGRARQNALVGVRRPGVGVVVPSAFAAYVALLPLLGTVQPLFWIPAAAYCGFNLIASLHAALSYRDRSSVAVLPLLFLTIHLAYPIGFLLESARIRIFHGRIGDVDAAAGDGLGAAVAAERGAGR